MELVIKLIETTWKGKHLSKHNTKIGRERGNSYRKNKKSTDERHTKTQRSLTETF